MRCSRLAWLPAGLTLMAWTGPTPDQAVAIRVFQFEPKVLEVAVGTQVVWTNGDEIEHTVTSGNGDEADGSFGGTLAGKGTTFSLKFEQPGVFSYFCDRHHFMRGEVRVTPTGKAGN
jgi:plastocyanin